MIVTDVNDNPPIIEVPEGCTTISEFHDIKESIATIKVTDADDSKTPNGQATLKIVSGNEEGEILNF